MDQKLVAQPRIHLCYTFVDSIQGCHLPHDIGFEGISHVVLSVLEITSFNILLDVLNRPAVIIIVYMNGTDLVHEWKRKYEVMLICVRTGLDSPVDALGTIFHDLPPFVEDL